MKKIFFTCFFVCVSLLSFAGFEGIITTQVISNGGQITSKWYFKNDQLKLQMNYQSDKGAVKVDMIMKKGSTKMIIITDSDEYKGYSEVDATTFTSTYTLSDLVFTTNGISNKEIIKYQASNSNYQSAVWMLDLDVDLSPFAHFFKDDPAFVLIAAKAVKGFPNKSILTDHNGELIYSLTIVKTEKINLSDTDFKIPEGFKKRDLVEIGTATKK